MKSIEVVAAVIFDKQGRIFATQRGYGEWKDWWEFPGGKMEAGETPQQASITILTTSLSSHHLSIVSSTKLTLSSIMRTSATVSQMAQ